MSTVIKAHWSCRPATSHLLGQRWHFVGSIVGLTLKNVVGSMSVCKSAQRYCQLLVQQALQMPT